MTNLKKILTKLITDEILTDKVYNFFVGKLLSQTITSTAANPMKVEVQAVSHKR